MQLKQQRQQVCLSNKKNFLPVDVNSLGLDEVLALFARQTDVKASSIAGARLHACLHEQRTFCKNEELDSNTE